MQVQWERGWIDVNQLENYRLDAVNANGDRDEEFSLVALMSSCLDFASELSELETMAKKMGATVMTTTKYHAEYAGEGIEYAWGVMKSYYRKIKLEDKNGKENFINNVKQLIARDDVLTILNVRRFAKRARSYLQAYLYLGSLEYGERNREETDED